MTKVKSYLDGVEAAHKIRDKSEAKLKERTAELEDMVRRLVKCLEAASEAVYRDTLNDDFDGILGLGWRDNEAEPLIAEAAQLVPMEKSE